MNKYTCIVTLTLCSLLGIVLPGCQDSDAQQRDATQMQLRQAAEQIRLATIGSGSPGSEAFDKADQSLDRLVKNLNTINVDASQQPAKAMLTATALRESGAMGCAKAADLEAQQRSIRTAMEGRIDAIATLDAVASGQQKIDPAQSKQELDQSIQQTQDRLKQLSDRLEKLAGPIAQQNGQNTDAGEKVKSLRVQVSELRNRASELGNAEGFDLYRKAVQTSREADKIEYQISQREMELGYTLQPDHNDADSESKNLQSRIEAIEATKSSLDEFAKLNGKNIQQMRTAISEMVSSLKENLQTLEQRSSAELDPIYEKAESALEKASSLAQQGGAGGTNDDLSAARLLKARILALKGQLNMQRVRGLTDQASILKRLSSAGPAAGELQQTAAKSLESVTAALTAATEKAKNAYSEALEAAGQVNAKNDGGALENFKKALENSVAIFTEKKPESPSQSTANATPGSEASGTPGETPDAGSAARNEPTAPSRVFATSDELYAYVTSLPKNTEGSKGLLSVVHAESPDGRRAIRVMNEMLASSQVIDEAMNEKFPGSAGVTSNLPLSDLSTARVTEKTSTRVVYSSLVMGKPSHTVFKKLGETWVIDGDSMDQQDRAVLAGMEKVSIVLSQNADDFAARIRKGEFKNAAEAQQALGQLIAGAMLGGANAPGH
jgi:predicted nuclease with TOPRIM domain